MKYIVNSKEVSRNTFYFCKRAKMENKRFVLLKYNNPDEIENYIIDNSEYDYYVCDDLATYYTKGEANVTEWYEKYRGGPKATYEDLKKKFEKSKCRTSTFTDWYTKNGWEYKSEIKYESKEHDIPTVEDFEEEVKTKFFSVKVNNKDTVKNLNKIREEYSECCIEYVLRDDAYTEIIYRDGYLEI